MKIYTKTGDLGETGLYGGKRVPKNHVRVEAVGTIDEANAAIGVAMSELRYQQAFLAELAVIQGKLFDIGAAVANPEPTDILITDADIEQLELSIDRMTAMLPELRAFILPGGTKGAAHLHEARTSVRRAERRVATVAQVQMVPPIASRYLNRLSDYLFTLARFVNFNEGGKEVMWRGHS
ncbi:MAG: cob(I)yrinic acid a,c-diamide adenosyltransferase [Candidatus Andersenbacteria bacterium]|nr:cob(I)yrinic acid a,c-diamide adenosyltransferase [Candidatus Andersenbacteria bacterium]